MVDVWFIFSCTGMLKEGESQYFSLYNEVKFYRGFESVVFIFDDKNWDGCGIRVCCARNCKYAGEFKRLDRWGGINR